jgi:hypothetical protein
VDRQPPLGIITGVLVFLSGLQDIFVRRLRPDLTGRDIDAAPEAEWIAISRMPASSSRSTGKARSIAAGPLPR